MSDAPRFLTEIGRRVEAKVARLLDDEIERWGGVEAELTEPLHSLRSLVLAGGKRLRPAFCYWGFVGCGGDPEDEAVVTAGAAFELLHAFALLHDDVMDGSATRRGNRTAHLVHADRHDQGRWMGEARRFGEGVAILVGDMAFVYADRLMSGIPAPALELWHELRTELNVGQYLDIVGTARGVRDLPSAERISRYKSGKYTVERPLHLGAALSGTPDLGRRLSQLSAYGIPLGDAFQLRDDVLGAFGDESVTGKPVGDDLIEGKPTPLLAIAVGRASVAQRDVLALVGRPALAADEIAAIQAVLIETGALDELEASIAAMARESRAAIEATDLAPGTVQALGELVDYVAWRDR